MTYTVVDMTGDDQVTGVGELKCSEDVLSCLDPGRH